MIKVVHCKIEEDCEYIGRPSALGNPFAMKNESEREDVIAKYQVWLTDKIKAKNEPVLKELSRLKSIAAKGDLKIGCWCAPRKCHGDVIKEFLELSLKKNDN